MQHQKIIDYIVSWLQDYAEKAGIKGYVIGISGGVDSGVVSTLCAKTGLDILLLELPIRQKEDQSSRAKKHMQFLEERYSNVRSTSIDLTKTFNTLEETFQDGIEQGNENLAYANMRSRLRMLTLYYYAQINHLLVCGTGNKVEDFGIGFYTKYGDGGVDISPIADLYKTEIFSLAKYLDLLPEIAGAIPTDGLWDAERTDEMQIGATYPELEKIQKEWGIIPEEAYTGRDAEVYAIFKRMNKAAQHKINPIPVCDIPENWRQ